MVFCHLNVSAYFYPKNKVWTEGDLCQVLEACKNIPSLTSVQADRNWHRRINVPATLEWLEWSKKQTFHCGTEGGDVRTNLCCLPFRSSYKCIPCVEILAKYGVKLQHFVDLVSVFKSCGHTLLATRGFDPASGRLVHKLTPTRTITLNDAKRQGIQVLTAQHFSRYPIPVSEESFDYEVVKHFPALL